MLEYLVEEVKHKTFFKGRLTAKDLESKINDFAKQGWILDRIIDGETQSFITGSKDVFLLIFKREATG